MQFLSRDIDNVIIVLALKDQEDSSLLNPAEEHIKWMKGAFDSCKVLDGRSEGTHKILTDLERESVDQPTLVEIIAHGNVAGTKMCNDVDESGWAEVADAILSIKGNYDIVVNAMTSCFSYRLVDELCSKVSAVFGSNLPSSSGTFARSRTLYLKPWSLFEIGEATVISESQSSSQNTWCINGKRQNQMTANTRYEFLQKIHCSAAYWKEWDFILKQDLKGTVKNPNSTFDSEVELRT